MNLLNDYLKSTFGTKVYKLALSNAVTCPNRDGKSALVVVSFVQIKVREILQKALRSLLQFK